MAIKLQIFLKVDLARSGCGPTWPCVSTISFCLREMQAKQRIPKFLEQVLWSRFISSQFQKLTVVFYFTSFLRVISYPFVDS